MNCWCDEIREKRMFEGCVECLEEKKWNSLSNTTKIKIIAYAKFLDRVMAGNHDPDYLSRFYDYQKALEGLDVDFSDIPRSVYQQEIIRTRRIPKQSNMFAS